MCLYVTARVCYITTITIIIIIIIIILSVWFEDWTVVVQRWSVHQVHERLR